MNLPTYTEHYCDLITALAHMHAHEDDKKPVVLVKKKVSNPLNYDDVEDLLDEASDHLGFIMYVGDFVWLKQNRELLEYIRDECDVDLWAISCRFDHLEPPSLRDEFDLPPPTV